MFFGNSGDRPPGIISRILWSAIGIAVSVLLIRWSVCTLLQIWPVLLVIALIVLGAVIAYRLYRSRNDRRP